MQQMWNYVNNHISCAVAMWRNYFHQHYESNRKWARDHLKKLFFYWYLFCKIKNCNQFTSFMRWHVRHRFGTFLSDGTLFWGLKKMRDGGELFGTNLRLLSISILHCICSTVRTPSFGSLKTSLFSIISNEQWVAFPVAIRKTAISEKRNRNVSWHWQAATATVIQV